MIKEGFSSWHCLLDSNAIRVAVRRVTIKTTPWEDLDRRSGVPEWEVWTGKGDWTAFTSAIKRICHLPHLDATEARFLDYCLRRNRDWPGPERESPKTRENTLKCVVKAMEQRAARLDMSPIHELVLENLQNMPLPKSLTDNLLSTIERLHIRVISEIHGTVEYDTLPEDTWLPEVREWEPYLQNTLLPSITEHLVKLTISSPFYWVPSRQSLTAKNYIFHD